MLDNAAVMFENMGMILNGLKKKTYEEYMNVFRENYKSYYDEIITYVEGSEDKAAAAKELAQAFCPQVIEAYAKRRGKVPKRVQMNLSFVMIYYFFPALLMTGSEDATIIADAFRDEWNKANNCNIGYTTYENIYNGFKNRIFGFEIG